MKEYRLIGFASFVCDAPGFLFPLFMSRGSNGVFSHLLDDDFNIERFFWVDPNEYFVREATDENNYSVGGEGLLCFRTLQGDLHFGSAVKVKEELVALDVEISCDEFSMIDVYSFLENKEKENSSIERAAKLFSDPMIAESWKLQQLGSSATVKSGVEAFPAGQREEVLRFSGALGGKGWVTQWLSYWRSGENRDFLAKLALDWLARVGHIEGQTPIYKCLLTHEPSYEAALESLVDWLYHNGWGFSGWGRLWCVGFEGVRADSEAERLLYDMGLEYILGENPWVRGHSKNKLYLANVNSWCSVWRHVTHDSSSIGGGDIVGDSLIFRLLQLSGVYGKNKFFWRGALLPSLENNIIDEDFKNCLKLYMLNKGPNSGWIRIYGWLIENDEASSWMDSRVNEIFEEDECAEKTRFEVWEVLYFYKDKLGEYFNLITTKYIINFPNDSFIDLVKFRVKGVFF